MTKETKLKIQSANSAEVEAYYVFNKAERVFYHSCTSVASREKARVSYEAAKAAWIAAQKEVLLLGDDGKGNRKRQRKRDKNYDKRK